MVRLQNSTNTTLEVAWEGNSDNVTVTCFCEDVAGGSCGSATNVSQVISENLYTCTSLIPGKLIYMRIIYYYKNP